MSIAAQPSEASLTEHRGLPARSSRETLRAYADYKRRTGKGVFCFQIGANDGRINDPVYLYFTRYGWHGLLVEPQVDVFEQELTATYRGNARVILANVAIADKDGSMPFYRLAVSNARWATGLSGFRRSSIDQHIADGHIRRSLEAEGKPYPANEKDLVRVDQVVTTTVPGLLAKHSIKNFDVLCIDTEGFDYEILKLIDFSTYRPELVLFESRHLSSSDFAGARRRLASYDLYQDDRDTMAVRRGSSAALVIDRMDRPLNVTGRKLRKVAGSMKRWLRARRRK